MTQLFLENNGDRFLPVINPLAQGLGLGTVDPEGRRRFDQQIRVRDVIELDRRILDGDGNVRFEPDGASDGRGNPDYALPPRDFLGFGSSGFTFERDVVANIYAANEALGSGPRSGPSVNLVA